MTNVTVGTVATAVVAARPSRTSLAIQHIGTATPTTRVWVSTDDTLVIGGGFVLSSLGATISISHEHYADSAWYAIAEADGVEVQVSQGAYH